MTKTILKTLIAASIATACVGIVAEPISAIMSPAERAASAYTEVFEINAIYPSSDYVMAHYYGLGDETKTKAVNIFWTDYSMITEEDADATFASYGLTTPEWANNFYNKTTELTPNTEESASWYLTRYRNTNAESKIIDAPGVLYYTVKLANGDLLSEKVDYRDCLDNEYYVADGGACKLERAESGELYFWPYKTGIRQGPDDEPKEEDEIIEDLEKDNETDDELKEDDGVEDDEVSSEDVDKLEENTETAQEINKNITEDIVVKAPETGIQNECKEGNKIDWWWLVIPSLVLIGLFVWWFILPLNREKSRK